MSQLETYEKLLMETFEISREEIKDEVTPEDLENWDSIIHMDLCAKFEESFDISLDVEDITEMQTLGLMKEVLKRYGVDL